MYCAKTKTETDLSCSEMGVRMADSVSDPFVSKVCLVVFCENENTQCVAEIMAEFYDAFAKPSAYATVIGSFALIDLLICTCFCLQCSGDFKCFSLFSMLVHSFNLQCCFNVGCLFMYWGMLGKYVPMLQDEREKRKQEAMDAQLENEIQDEFASQQQGVVPGDIPDDVILARNVSQDINELQPQTQQKQKQEQNVN